MNRLLLLLAVSLLSACSSSPKIDSGLKSQLWLEHQLVVSGINSWKIKGRIAVKNDKESGTATLHWNQNHSNFELRVVAPLGQGTYILKGTPDGVIMQDPKKNVMMAETPEKLLYEGLGWDISLDGLVYWVRGIPDPNIDFSQLLLDDKGRLSNMKQSGFKISVLRYTDYNGVSLPEKIFIESDNIQLKLIIQNWKT